MNTDERRCPDSLTGRVIGGIVEVSNILGSGFLEKVYERALLRELHLRGIRATAQASFAVSYTVAAERSCKRSRNRKGAVPHGLRNTHP